MRVVDNKNLPKVFVVEDEEFFAGLLNDFLINKLTDDVSVFSTGEQCLQAMDQNPDVVIIDYFLNSKNKDAANGLEILRRIRNTGSTAHVIILSSQTEFGVAMQAHFDGAQHYVIKNNDAFNRILALIKTG